MGARGRIIVLLFLTLIVCAVALAVLRLQQPMYAGQPFKKWLDDSTSESMSQREKASIILTKILESDERWENRAIAAMHIGLSGVRTDTVWTSLARALKDDHPGVRRAVVRAFVLLRPVPEQQMSVLLDGLSDEDEDVRHGVLRVLAGLGPEGEAAAKILVSRLRTAQGEKCERIIRGLACLGERARLAAPDLRELLNDNDERVRNLAAEALSRIEKPVMQ